jgi:hypothetical protein
MSLEALQSGIPHTRSFDIDNHLKFTSMVNQRISYSIRCFVCVRDTSVIIETAGGSSSVYSLTCGYTKPQRRVIPHLLRSLWRSTLSHLFRECLGLIPWDRLYHDITYSLRTPLSPHDSIISTINERWGLKRGSGLRMIAMTTDQDHSHRPDITRMVPHGLLVASKLAPYLGRELTKTCAEVRSTRAMCTCHHH